MNKVAPSKITCPAYPSGVDCADDYLSFQLARLALIEGNSRL